jgi:hypothetical protein
MVSSFLHLLSGVLLVLGSFLLLTSMTHYQWFLLACYQWLSITIANPKPSLLCCQVSNLTNAVVANHRLSLAPFSANHIANLFQASFIANLKPTVVANYQVSLALSLGS